jgi:hypothetical protein
VRLLLLLSPPRSARSTTHRSTPSRERCCGLSPARVARLDMAPGRRGHQSQQQQQQQQSSQRSTSTSSSILRRVYGQPLSLQDAVGLLAAAGGQQDSQDIPQRLSQPGDTRAYAGVCRVCCGSACALR